MDIREMRNRLGETQSEFAERYHISYHVQEKNGLRYAEMRISSFLYEDQGIWEF